MSDVGDLVDLAWLRAQFDADAALAEGLEYWASYVESTQMPNTAAEGAYMRRVLREVESKRRILDLWENPADVDRLPEGVHDGRDPDERERDVAVAEAIDGVVRLLALAYVDRPGYREEWRP